MKQFVALILIIACQAATAGAQTFTERLQKKVKNQGTVTVNQSAAIDELVNGTVRITPQPAGAPTTAKAQAGSQQQPPAAKLQPAQKPAAEAAQRETHRAAEADAAESGADTPVIDTSKKVMRGAYKVNGYRVQAFAGGNTRRDRLQAERIGNEIKTLFPMQPVYVHFYSPRWICRVGNFRTYEEAHQMLTELRKLGYNQALIVKGKITVQY
ncbi:SPOR domain-containing protein [Marseilla massiliensis]|uniref:SPOR domain-containing protein n=1 Tax=Marseilla massiliensis TaxID=1841864 RepID=A0A938WKJ9_9BACT|nr:SPOR domain-containing protein [Marseilla massiliensis]MBM6660825.1 SPOR domain-containing protein [Marseilla massiliensis]